MQALGFNRLNSGHSADCDQLHVVFLSGGLANRMFHQICDSYYSTGSPTFQVQLHGNVWKCVLNASEPAEPLAIEI